MRPIRIRVLLLWVLVACFACFVSCKRHSEVEEEAYVPIDGSVGFEMLSLGNADGTKRWLATYTNEGGRTTKFRIEMGPDQGNFLAEAGSDPMPLLEALKSALHAKHIPDHVKKADIVPFAFALLGEGLSRSPKAGFVSKPGGNWTATKLSLANGKAEVYFNFNLRIHKGEFSLKDDYYGDALLQEFAKVL